MHPYYRAAAVREGPPAAPIVPDAPQIRPFADAAPYWELYDLAGRPLSVYPSLRDAIRAVRRGWPRRTELILKHWVPEGTHYRADVEWIVRVNAGGQLEHRDWRASP